MCFSSVPSAGIHAMKQHEKSEKKRLSFRLKAFIMSDAHTPVLALDEIKASPINSSRTDRH
jgi:hypothetical protein